MADQRTNRVLALVALAGALAIGLFVALAFSRFLADFWPPDNSRVGPNLVAAVVQTVIVLVATAILYPPFRRFLVREWDHVHAKLDHLIDTNHHIIRHHPVIPDTDHTGTPWVDKRPAPGRPS